MTRTVATPVMACAVGAAALLAFAASPVCGQDQASVINSEARREPAVAAVLEMPRDTPVAQMRAVFALINLDRPEIAAELFPQLTEANLSNVDKASLVERFGTARFMRLIRQTKPGGAGPGHVDLPAAAEFAQSCLDAAAAIAREPKRLAQAVEQVASDDPRLRKTAADALLSAGDAGIQACVNALANADHADARSRLLATLAAMHPAVDRPVIALLAEGKGRLRRDAAELAGHLRLYDALPWLASLSVGRDAEVAATAGAALRKFDLPQPTPGDAAELVRRELEKLAKRDAAARSDPINQGDWWTWNHEAGELVKVTVSPRQARALKLARLARARSTTAPAIDSQLWSMSLLYGWEEAAALNRDPNPAAVPDALSPADLSDLLRTALRDELYAAATRCVELLGERNDPRVLSSADGQPAPLAAALSSPHHDLRFAALRSVLKLNPPTSFAGASDVVESLWFFAAGAGDSTAVAAAATIPRANTWAGQLRSLGYDAIAATTGRAALEAALDRSRAARLVLVAIDSDISMPQVRETVFQLRRSQVAAHAPIAVLCSLARLEDMQQLADDDPLLLAEPRPHGDEAMAEVVARLTALAAAEPASDEVRTARARFALSAIADLLAADAPYDELVRDAELVNTTLYHPTLSDPAIRVLSLLGTTASQEALTNFANAAALPLESRRKAAVAFVESVKRFGVQLPQDEINRQYQRYNASEFADAETQAMLSSMLDVLEGAIE